MDDRGLAIFREFESESAPNAGNVARHRYIDDFLRAWIAREPELQIVLLGCGFDSRAFRLRLSFKYRSPGMLNPLLQVMLPGAYPGYTIRTYRPT